MFFLHLLKRSLKRRLSPVNIPHFVFYFLLFAAFALKGIIVLDPDFGWHIELGKYILAHGIPKGDPFSYTMPSYPFVDHEWLTNALYFIMYRIFGRGGFAVLYAALPTLLFYFLTKKYSGWGRIALAATYFSILFPFAGVRPQVITWIFTAVFLRVLELKNKPLWILPAIMVLWVNLHGGFFLGIGILAAYIGALIISSKKIPRPELLCWVLLVSATFVNPYGIRIWWEVGMQLSDARLRFGIYEWMPAVIFINITYWIYAAFATSFILRYSKKIPLYQRLLYWIFLIAGLLSVRNIPLWVVVSSSPVFLGASALIKEARSTKRGQQHLDRALFYFKRALVVTILVQIAVLAVEAGGQRIETSYPVRAVNYIRKTNLKGRMMSLYGWGGYLIWQLPEKKVFIDGRMPSWRRAISPPGESVYAYKEYDEFFESEERMKQIRDKYNISYVLLPAPRNKSYFEKWMETLFPRRKQAVNPVYSLKEIYNDGVSTLRSFDRRGNVGL